MRPALALVLAAFCGSLFAQGEIYKWKDEKGVTHYGERPGNKSAEPVILRPGSEPAIPEQKKRPRTQVETCRDARRDLSRVKSSSAGQQGLRQSEVEALEDAIARSC